jgi:hypothetical protein
MEPGTWNVEHGTWNLEPGTRSKEHGTETKNKKPFNLKLLKTRQQIFAGFFISHLKNQ